MDFEKKKIINKINLPQVKSFYVRSIVFFSAHDFIL